MWNYYYADDTECESTSKPEDYKELEYTINNDLHRVKEYFDTNTLSIFVYKCRYGLSPPQYVCGRFNANYDIHNHNTTCRNASLRVTKQSATPCFSYLFFNKAVTFIKWYDV